eukprot:4338801-Amphidinium_carterae.2
MSASPVMIQHQAIEGHCSVGTRAIGPCLMNHLAIKELLAEKGTGLHGSSLLICKWQILEENVVTCNQRELSEHHETLWSLSTALP